MFIGTGALPSPALRQPGSGKPSETSLDSGKLKIIMGFRSRDPIQLKILKLHAYFALNPGCLGHIASGQRPAPFISVLSQAQASAPAY